MKSYKGGYNKQNLSFIIPYFNEREGKQELYLVTHKLVDVTGRDASKERNLVINLVLKGERLSGSEILLPQMYRSIIDSDTRHGVLNRFFSSKKIVIEGGQDVLRTLTTSQITRLNKKLLQEQIKNNADFRSSAGMLAEVKRLFVVMVTALEHRRNVPVTPSVTPAVLPTDSPTDSPGSKKTDDATVTPSVLPADSPGSKKDNDDEAQNSKNWCEKFN